MTEETALIDNIGGGPEKSMLGHPRGLFILFISEMWERSCYYGMRVLLTLYLVKISNER